MRPETTEGRPCQDGPHGTTSPPATIPDIIDITSLLALSDERDLWQRVSLCRERAAYRRGHGDGRRDGYAAGRADADAEWMDALEPARAASRLAARLPTHAQLEVRRWGPGGREHFGAPRPGDYPGQGGAAA